MNEIEKMYENAGIVPVTDCEHGCNTIGLTKNCKDCIYVDEIKYPPFTAEKQIELIKFLFNHSVYYDVDEKGNYWFHITDDCYTYYYNKFEIALANIINEMWQDLTEEERKQIKDILK